MKVLVLNGSPRRGGNIEILLEETLKGVQDSGAHAKVYHLNSLSLTPCQQCGGCDDSSQCVLQDDMLAIHDDIITSDRIIVASPIFFFNVTAQTKIMIDRCQPFWSQKYVHKKPLPAGTFGRKGLLILVGGMKRGEKNEGFHCSEIVVRSFFRTVSVPKHETLAFGDIDEKGAIRNHATALKDAYEAGENISR
ncbi:MAG TPA: flavodoxin family protein [Nitrospirota bacterium]|nr:flavodoxin family protein [Nitrospirota bacterium]